jgi:MFS family permease
LNIIFLGPHIAGPLTDRIGRKWTLLSSSVFFISSYILLATTKSVTQIYIARILQGFGVGFVMTTQTMYIGEISTDDCRGALGSFMQLAIAIGIVSKLKEIFINNLKKFKFLFLDFCLLCWTLYKLHCISNYLFNNSYIVCYFVFLYA